MTKEQNMTRDDIIRMAEEAGFQTDLQDVWITYDGIWSEEFERFAALVAAEKEQQMIRDGYRKCAEGQRTTQFCGLLEEAVKAEREACAKICDDISWSNEGKWFAVDSGKLMKYVKEEQKPVRILELKIDSDCMDEIVKADLAGVRDSLRLDLERRKQGKYSNGIFHHDKKKDIAEVRKHINAFNLILKYYNVPE
jgi:hypothetical protein